MNDAVNYVDLFGLTSNDICYTVQPGDCVWKIADKSTKEGVPCTTQQLIDNNNFANPNLIHPGDKIYIPVAKPAAANDTGSTISVATPSNNGSNNVSTNTTNGGSFGSAPIGGGAGNVSMGGGSSGSSFASVGMSGGGQNTTAQANTPMEAAAPSVNNNLPSVTKQESIRMFLQDFRELGSEFLDIFSLEFKVGLGIDLDFIVKDLVHLDLMSLKGAITKEGFSDTYSTTGIGGLGLSYTAETTTTPAINDIYKPENATISILGFEMNGKDNKFHYDYKYTIGGQFFVGVYFNFSAKEFWEFLQKVGELNYEAKH